MRPFLQDERGGVAIMTSAFAGVMLVLAALAVDLGSIFLQSRKLQGAVDLAAMAAAADLPHAEAAARATLVSNGWTGPIELVVEPGVYAADPAKAAKTRFAAAAAPANAVRVRAKVETPLYFGAAILGKPTTPIARVGTASRPGLATFSIGSRLAALDGGVANALLSGLTGSSVKLSVMDYNALATADVNLLTYVSALSTEAHLQGVSFDEVLQADISTGKALSILADQLGEQGAVAASQALRKISIAAGNSRMVDLDRLLDLGPYAAQDYSLGGAAVKVSALDLTNAMLALAQEGRQVKLDLGTTIPGLGKTTVWLAIGERPNQSPWLAVTDRGEPVIRTAQTRLYIETDLTPAGGVLGSAGVGAVRLPVLIEAASGEARLSAIRCPAEEVDLAVRPSIGSAAIGDIDLAKLSDFKHELTIAPAEIVSLLLVKATAAAKVKIGGTSWRTVTFSKADIEARTVKTVSTTDAVGTLVATLLGDTEINVTLAGLGLGTGGLTNALASTLSVAGAPLDLLVNQLTELLGLKLGQADVRVEGVRCGAAILVA